MSNVNKSSQRWQFAYVKPSEYTVQYLKNLEYLGGLRFYWFGYTEHGDIIGFAHFGSDKSKRQVDMIFRNHSEICIAKLPTADIAWQTVSNLKNVFYFGDIPLKCSEYFRRMHTNTTVYNYEGEWHNGDNKCSECGIGDNKLCSIKCTCKVCREYSNGRGTIVIKQNNSESKIENKT